MIVSGLFENRYILRLLSALISVEIICPLIFQSVELKVAAKFIGPGNSLGHY